tara:strand:- start:736 stop:885 length:150 start_codon:yes stop_codon:yes gene_type:complete
MKVTIPMDYWTTSPSKTPRQKYYHSITPLPNYSGDERDKRVILTYVENS